MDAPTRDRAEARLTAAVAALDLKDPRPRYRALLKQLRENDSVAFDDAVRHYESQVLPALLDDEPLAVWLEYGRYLARLSGPGEMHMIDASGRARVAGGDDVPGSVLVLWIPDAAASDVFVAAEPATLSAAQSATIELLVHGRVSLPASAAP